ncbi:hypothetical protein HD806DRAFT_496829 [Xylariaceae sp. AK1471]|nr:hypothetical protein HD806DRAFT_496829 [Xylariaceae sp. AK1471]
MADPTEFYGQATIPVATFSIVLSTLFIGMRFWSRAIILRVVALEDWLILLGWIFAIGVSIGNIVQLGYGLGRPFATPFSASFQEYLKVALSINIIYAFALAFVKVSILCLYIRAFNYDYVRRAAKILLVIVVITHLWIILSLFTVCVPLEAFWDRTKRPTAYCHPFSVYWSHAGINISTDFLIFALPLTVLHKVHAPRGQKIALYLVFLLAFFVCIISLVRSLQFVHGMAKPARATVIVGCWTMLEVNIAVVCACLTTIKPLLARVFPRLLSSSKEGDYRDIETIGRARQKPRDPFSSDITTIVSTGSRQSDTATENVKMGDLEAQKGCDSASADLKTLNADQGSVPPTRCSSGPSRPMTP